MGSPGALGSWHPRNKESLLPQRLKSASDTTISSATFGTEGGLDDACLEAGLEALRDAGLEER